MHVWLVCKPNIATDWLKNSHPTLESQSTLLMRLSHHSLVFLNALTTMNFLKTVSKEVKQISTSSCLCPFWYVVLEYSLHHGILCCMGMLQSLKEINVAWVAKVRSSNLTTFRDLNNKKNMWANHIQRMHLHFHTLSNTTPLGSLRFFLLKTQHTEQEKQCKNQGKGRTKTGSSFMELLNAVRVLEKEALALSSRLPLCCGVKETIIWRFIRLKLRIEAKIKITGRKKTLKRWPSWKQEPNQEGEKEQWPRFNIKQPQNS